MRHQVTAVSDTLTRSVEDYLKAIYRLSGDDRPASTSEIAQHLALAPASVSGMVKRLSEQGLLEHERYRGVQLTPDGKRVALRMLRRHRLIESYLVANLGYSWDTVHDEAERLEHAVSDDLVERMADALGNPRVDPHGDPIPSADGSMPVTDVVSLAEVEPGHSARIQRVSTREPDFLRHLAQLGLVPGARVTLRDRRPFLGPITVETEEATHVVGHELASALLCTVEGA